MAFPLQDHHTVRSLRLQEAGFARLLSLVVWLLLLLIMVPNMALPTKEVKVQFTLWLFSYMYLPMR